MGESPCYLWHWLLIHGTVSHLFTREECNLFGKWNFLSINYHSFPREHDNYNTRRLKYSFRLQKPFFFACVCVQCACLYAFVSSCMWADNAGSSSLPCGHLSGAGITGRYLISSLYWGLKLVNCSGSRGKGFSGWALSPAPALIIYLLLSQD